jgi:hypothetical protein
MHSPRSLLRQRTPGEFGKCLLEVPDAFFANAPGNRDMDRFGHIRAQF